jgi:hypothetical protein
MASFRLKLVCMNAGPAPGDEQVHYLQEDKNAAETWILYYCDDGRFKFSDDFDEIDDDSVEVLAKLSRSKASLIETKFPSSLTYVSESFYTFSILLEALVDNIYIEPAISPKLTGLYDSDRIKVPQSNSAGRHYIVLRPDDIINLKEDGVKVMVVAEKTNTTNSVQSFSGANITLADRQQAEIQVKSSNAGSDQDFASEEMKHETDESDDDLDPTVAGLPARALSGGETTPATKRTINQTIMETPSATTLPKDIASEPYPTAHEVPTSDTVILRDQGAESPTTRVQETKVTKVVMEDSPLAQEVANLPSTPPAADFDMSDQTPLAVRTYGAEQAGRTIHTKIGTLALENTSASGFEQGVEQIEEIDMDVRSSPDLAVTSEYEPKDVAYAAASASMTGSAKRKVSDLEDEEQSEGMMDPCLSSNKRRFRGPRVMQEQHEDGYAEGAKSETIRVNSNAIERDDLSIEKSEQSDADEAEPEEDIKPARKGRKGKLAKPARRSIKSISRTSQPPKSSPELVVTTSRSIRKRQSGSPQSSMASSMLAGGTPSILLSSDSPLRKPASANFLKSKGASIIDDVKTRRAHFVCVLNGDKLTTTAKVLRSLALGKLVVTEDWIMMSKKAKELLEPEDFVHKDLKHTIEKDRSVIFHGINLFFTTALAEAYGKGFKAIKDLAKDAGANHVEVGSTGSFGSFKNGRMEVICFGQRDNDPDVERLQQSHKVKVYHKNLLTQSILKGELDMDGDEHVL